MIYNNLYQLIMLFFKIGIDNNNTSYYYYKRYL